MAPPSAFTCRAAAGAVFTPCQQREFGASPPWTTVWDGAGTRVGDAVMGFTPAGWGGAGPSFFFFFLFSRGIWIAGALVVHVYPHGGQYGMTNGRAGTWSWNDIPWSSRTGGCVRVDGASLTGGQLILSLTGCFRPRAQGTEGWLATADIERFNNVIPVMYCKNCRFFSLFVSGPRFCLGNVHVWVGYLMFS